MGAEVFDCGAPRPDLPPEDVVEDLSHIFLTLEVTDQIDIIKFLKPF